MCFVGLSNFCLRCKLLRGTLAPKLTDFPDSATWCSAKLLIYETKVGNITWQRSSLSAISNQTITIHYNNQIREMRSIRQWPEILFQLYSFWTACEASKLRSRQGPKLWTWTQWLLQINLRGAIPILCTTSHNIRDWHSNAHVCSRCIFHTIMKWSQPSEHMNFPRFYAEYYAHTVWFATCCGSKTWLLKPWANLAAKFDAIKYPRNNVINIKSKCFHRQPEECLS